MNPASINSIAHVESMTVIVLMLVVAVAKAIQRLLKRRFPSHLTLQTDSFDLTLQTKQHLSPQESLRPGPQGDDKDANSDNDDGRIPPTTERTHF
jgi:hypothetical protein